MTTLRKPGFALWIAFTLAVLLGLYVGAYYAMVAAIPGESLPYYRVSTDPNGDPRFRRPTSWETFFAPVHWLDRRLRPHVWEPER